jgi:hypothetical protein
MCRFVRLHCIIVKGSQKPTHQHGPRRCASIGQKAANPPYFRGGQEAIGQLAQAKLLNGETSTKFSTAESANDAGKLRKLSRCGKAAAEVL